MRTTTPSLLLLLLLHVPVIAHASDDPAPEKSTFQRLDDAFGEWFVGPLASVMFFDVWFWDNELRPDDAIGLRINGDEVTSYDPARGFGLSKVVRAEASELNVMMETPAVVRVGRVSVEVSGDAPPYAARVKQDLVDINGAAQQPLSSWQGAPFVPDVPPLDAATPRVVIENIAPFPVLVELREGGAVAVPHEVPSALVLPSPKVGDIAHYRNDQVTVRALDGTMAEVVGAERYETRLVNPKGIGMPFIVLWLVIGAVYFTLRMSFINLRGFWHAVEVTRGRFDHEGDEGEISHFQALSSALSATVGLGNIAGVAVAVATGGPGAVFWMIVAGFLGMSSKFVECTLGQMYRERDPLGAISGGPMRYLRKGLGELGFTGLGRALSVLFAVMCIGGSFGGGNMFQANQAFAAVREAVQQLTGHSIASYNWLFGLVLAALVGLVIIGGIKRIGAAAGVIVPIMCGMYLLAGLWVIVVHADQVPWALTHILREAFQPEAAYGGAIGVLMIGFKRAAFSNEAGVGSASIAHSAATTEEPVREGIVALLEPFIDTIIVCTMTGVVVVVTKAYQSGGEGIVMTQTAFGAAVSWFPLVLSVAVLLFAFSTMISWSYYGERCFTMLFGEKTSMLYRVIFLLFAFLGCVLQLQNVLDFSDLMVLGMAFPNVLGAVLLSGKVKARLDDYWGRYTSGAMPRAK